MPHLTYALRQIFAIDSIQYIVLYDIHRWLVSTLPILFNLSGVKSKLTTSSLHHCIVGDSRVVICGVLQIGKEWVVWIFRVASDVDAIKKKIAIVNDIGLLRRPPGVQTSVSILLLHH